MVVGVTLEIPAALAKTATGVSVGLTDSQQQAAVPGAAPSPLDRVHVERDRARGQRALAALRAHLAACDPDPLRELHWRLAEIHLAAARVHDSTADRIEKTDRRRVSR
jgi:hypothetical protein